MKAYTDVIHAHEVVRPPRRSFRLAPMVVLIALVSYVAVVLAMLSTAPEAKTMGHLGSIGVTQVHNP